MGEYKIGEASWDDDDVSTQERPQGDRKRIPFLRMENGKDYKMRIVSKPYRYYYKWARKSDGKQVKLNSSLTEDCPLAADGEEPSVGWYAKVLYRDPDGKTIPSVLDFGKQIKKGIQAYQKNPDFGQDIHKYDITISKGAKGAMPLYTVQASPPKPLTDEEKAMAKAINKKELDGKENPDYIDLEERCKPLPVETIRKILAGETGGSSAAPAASAPDESGVFEDESVNASESKTETPAPAESSNTESVKADDEDFLDF